MGLIYLLGAVCTIVAFTSVAAGPRVKPNHRDMFWGLDKPKEKYSLKRFPYSYRSMHPIIDYRTMEIHYKDIYGGLVKKLNKFMKKWRESKDPKHAMSKGLAKKSIVEIWRNYREVPNDLKKEFAFYAGGYINHLLYFSTMTTQRYARRRKPTKVMMELIEHSFNNMTTMQKEFTDTAMGLFGTGWVYIVRCTGSTHGEYLTVMSTLEEMTPLDNKRIFPILAVDLWEHAYFIRYGNNRAKYLKNWWKSIDWHKVERLLNWWRIQVPTKVAPPPKK